MEGVKMKVRENFERMEEVVKFIAGWLWIDIGEKEAIKGFENTVEIMSDTDCWVAVEIEIE